MWTARCSHIGDGGDRRNKHKKVVVVHGHDGSEEAESMVLSKSNQSLCGWIAANNSNDREPIVGVIAMAFQCHKS